MKRVLVRGPVYPEAVVYITGDKLPCPFCDGRWQKSGALLLKAEYGSVCPECWARVDDVLEVDDEQA